jgi:hypothetical protein
LSDGEFTHFVLHLILNSEELLPSS